MGESKELDLDSFLSKLENTLNQGAKEMLHVLKRIPAWALSCSNLFYTDKSIPQEFHQPGQLFISYQIDQPGTNKPKVVQLRGKAKDDKHNIIRNLKVTEDGSSITISSQHVSNFNVSDFKSDECSYTTYSGSGKTFETALDEYFSKCDLKQSNYIYKTKDNVQPEGDAFLFQKQLDSKGSEAISKEIIHTIREIFKLIPNEKHQDVLKLINKTMQHFKELLNKGEIKPLAHHYDLRLWMIVESICEHLDPIEKAPDPKRKQNRDQLIAGCCTKILKGERDQITPCLDAYFKALHKHREIMSADEEGEISDELRKILQEYRSLKSYPENKESHETIDKYHQKCRQHKKSDKAQT